MDLNLPYLTDEHKSLVMLMKEFCEREVDPKALCEIADIPIPKEATKNDLRARLPWDLFDKAFDAGLWQLPIPVEYGGGGYGDDWVALGALAETAGFYGGQMGRIFTIQWKQLANLQYFPKPVQEEVYAKVTKGRKTLLAASITEPNSGSNFLIPYDEPGATGQFFARQEGDEWVLNGDKMYCEAGGVADYVILNVRTEPKGPITRSVTTFLFPTDTPGWSIRVNDMMGNEVFPNVQQHFENCRIPDRFRITPVNEGFEAMKARFTGISIHYFGIMGWARRTWEEMKEYAKARIQGGKPIIQHNNVGQLIAEGDELLRAIRLLLYQNAYESVTEGAAAGPLGYYLLSWYSKMVQFRLVEIGMEVYGGMAPQKELNFEHWVRVHISGMHGGSTGILNLVKAASFY
jgi:alkylation response protein AidB-like acyl-CoA dehydrogenase